MTESAEQGESAHAQAPARSDGVASPQIVANIPENCEQTALQVDLDMPSRYLLPQIAHIGVLRKMTHGDGVILSARGLGVLALEGFVPAASADHPPFVVLSDGTLLTARQVLNLPEKAIALEGCQPRQSLDQWAENLAQIATAAGAPHELVPVSFELRPAAVVMAQPLATDSGGARFKSEFAVEEFTLAPELPIEPPLIVAAPVGDAPTGAALAPVDQTSDGGRSILGGAGDDTLVFESLANTHDGGGGINTLRIDHSAFGLLDFSSTNVADQRFERIDRIDLEGGNAVTLRIDVQGVLNLEPQGNVLHLLGGDGDTIDLSEPIGVSGDGWMKTLETATTDTWTYVAANADPIATLVVENTVMVT